MNGARSVSNEQYKGPNPEPFANALPSALALFRRRRMRNRLNKLANDFPDNQGRMLVKYLVIPEKFRKKIVQKKCCKDEKGANR